MTPDRTLFAQVAPRLLCLLGLHAWEQQHYWSLEDELVVGPVCQRCRACSQKGRQPLGRRWTP